jgi:hypothetical protein
MPRKGLLGRRGPLYLPPEESGLVRARVWNLRAAEVSTAEKDLKTKWLKVKPARQTAACANEVSYLSIL